MVCHNTRSKTLLLLLLLLLKIEFVNVYPGSRVDAVGREIAFHQCGPGSIPRLDVICGLSLLVLYSCQRGFWGYFCFPQYLI